MRSGIRTGEAGMACHGADIGGLALSGDTAADQKFFELGMMCAAADLVSAHKWFNLAALHGHKQASLLRVEIAAEMSETEIAAAQRAARDWLATR
jgi:TPR repeat protein